MPVFSSRPLHMELVEKTVIFMCILKKVFDFFIMHIGNCMHSLVIMRH